jgi:hypothetical protein
MTALRFLLGFSAVSGLAEKKGPLRGPCGGGFINRRQRKARKRRLRTRPLNRPRFVITSKMAVNFIFVFGHQNVVLPPHARRSRVETVLYDLKKEWGEPDFLRG